VFNKEEIVTQHRNTAQHRTLEPLLERSYHRNRTSHQKTGIKNTGSLQNKSQQKIKNKKTLTTTATSMPNASLTLQAI